MWVIYGLRRVDETEYRYVGLTRVGAKTRLAQHVSTARSPKARRHVNHWLRANAGGVVIDVLEECEEGDAEQLFDAEVRWIAKLREEGHNLTNSSDGGASGSFGARWTLRDDQIRRGEDHPNAGRPKTEAQLEVGRRNRGRIRSDESRRKQAESVSGENHWRYKQRGGPLPPKEPKPRTYHRGEDHHFFGKKPHNAGQPMDPKTKAALAEASADAQCIRWHSTRGYLDPNCPRCVTRSEVTGTPLSTPTEIASAKAQWKAGRDPEAVAASQAKRLASRAKNPRTREQNSEAALAAAERRRAEITPEAAAEESDRRKAAWTPERRAAHSEQARRRMANRTQEEREAFAASQAAAWTPEMRAAQAERVRDRAQTNKSTTTARENGTTE